MSKADSMFKELGYEKVYEHKTAIKYENAGETIIRFNKDTETLRIYNNSIDIEELQAINEKLKELTQEYKPNQSNTFIESQERYIELVKKLELLGE